MDFFKSVFSKDPQPSESSDSENPNPKPNTMWSSVIENYRKDFEEFRSGLRRETSMIREAASRAVKDLPGSFEVGASVAQESLESVGQAIDDIGSTVWKSTAEIISHGRRNLLIQPPDQCNSDYENYNNNSRQLSDVKPYSRFEMQLHSIQSDYNTFCREPEDLEEYENWKLGFKLNDEKHIETENLVQENGLIGQIYRDLVLTNKVVDEETFWNRYFYRLHRLKQAEDARARLVKRAISMEEDEDLSWDFDDDEEEGENNGSLVKGESSGNLENKKRDSDDSLKKRNESENPKNGNSGIEEDESDKLVVVEEKAENGGGSCKDSDVSIVSSQPSMLEEEDLSWDAIEDIGSNVENKGDAVGSTSRADLRKRLSAAEEDEVLSWDIEDDCEPVKS